MMLFFLIGFNEAWDTLHYIANHIIIMSMPFFWIGDGPEGPREWCINTSGGSRNYKLDLNKLENYNLVQNLPHKTSELNWERNQESPASIGEHASW
jgi:hypothetical protein